MINVNSREARIKEIEEIYDVRMDFSLDLEFFKKFFKKFPFFLFFFYSIFEIDKKTGDGGRGGRFEKDLSESNLP